MKLKAVYRAIVGPNDRPISHWTTDRQGVLRLISSNAHPAYQVKFVRSLSRELRQPILQEKVR